MVDMLSTAFISNVGFFITGIMFVPLYQQASYWGFNQPTSFLAAYAFFFFMCSGGLVQLLVERRGRAGLTEDSVSHRRYTTRQKQLCLGIGILTLMDNVIAIVGITYIGGMLYSIIYGWVVVTTALIRRFVLKKTIGKFQWIGVIVVGAGLSIAGLEGDSSTAEPTTYIIGLAAVFIASTCDAFMYVCVEDLLGMEAGVAGVFSEATASELTFIVGCVGSAALAPVAWVYAVTGYWQTALYEPMREHVDTMCTERFGVRAGHEPDKTLVVIFWVCGGLCMYVHYYSFYCVVKSVSNAVVAGVAKSMQSAVIFFVNAVLFGACDERQHVTTLKVVSAMAVISGTLLYTMCKEAPPAHSTPMLGGARERDSSPAFEEQRGVSLN